MDPRTAKLREDTMPVGINVHVSKESSGTIHPMAMATTSTLDNSFTASGLHSFFGRGLLIADATGFGGMKGQRADCVLILTLAEGSTTYETWVKSPNREAAAAAAKQTLYRTVSKDQSD